MPSESERVYVVSLSADSPSGSRISWRDIVQLKRRFFLPIGGLFPKEPVSWLGFRFDSKLQAVHKVERVIEVPNLAAVASHFPELDPAAFDRPADPTHALPHFVYTLGESIELEHEIVNGQSVVGARRIWADLDLLLSCESIAEAERLTRHRIARAAILPKGDVAAS
ncbi:MAG TPA: hypothetical protein PK402_12140 [Tepidisphaeraceae bacterium]|nr:hypothetical protein [Tepidisphaeraceae bacterium]